jgi:threonine dehydrogenase-like Zn-dependent dehydrogenase
VKEEGTKAKKKKFPHMKAVTFAAPYELRLETIAEPALTRDDEALVKVRLAGICGSDLHPYCGREAGLDVGTVMGHEFLGEVVAVGKAVATLSPGDLVVSAFSTSCGECAACLDGLSARCVRSQLFGWREKGAGLHGAQAEMVLVPCAQGTLVPVPKGLRHDVALLAGDILATGFYCARRAGVCATTRSVVVVGCGPVGLMAVVACRLLGFAGPLFAVDSVAERLALASSLGGPGATTTVTPDEALAAVKGATGGAGVSASLEVVGAGPAVRLAFDCLAPGGILSSVGVNTQPTLPFSPTEAYDKNLTFLSGRCPARSLMDHLLSLLVAQPETAEKIATIITHRIRIEDAIDAYRRFEARAEGCVKTIIEF